MTEQDQNQNLEQTQKLNREQNQDQNASSTEFNGQKTQKMPEVKAPRVYWYQKIARSFPASVGVAIGVLLVIALTSGLSAFAGTQVGKGSDVRGKAQIEQFDDRGFDKGGNFDRGTAPGGDERSDMSGNSGDDKNSENADNADKANKGNTSGGEEDGSNDNSASSDRGSKPNKNGASIDKGASSGQATEKATA